MHWFTYSFVDSLLLLYFDIIYLWFMYHPFIYLFVGHHPYLFTVHTHTYTHTHRHAHTLAQNYRCEFCCRVHLTCKNNPFKLDRRRSLRGTRKTVESCHRHSQCKLEEIGSWPFPFNKAISLPTWQIAKTVQEVQKVKSSCLKTAWWVLG